MHKAKAVRRNGNRSKGKLLDAVIELLDQREPAQVTITDVATLAGTTRPTFYLAFGDLPTAFAEAALARIADAFAGEAVVEIPAADLKETMRTAITRILARLEPHAEFFSRVLSGHGGHIVQTRVVTFVANELSTNTPLAPALACGPLPIEMSSTALAAAIAHMMLLWFAEETRTPVKTLAEHMRNVIYCSVYGGLGAGGTTPQGGHS